MQRRLIAAILAVVLAGVGALLLFNYVSNADLRAMANQEPVDVLVATTTVKAGTLGSELGSLVTTKQIPKAAVAPGALTSLNEVQHLATMVELQPGEQLMQSRFGEPGTAANGDIKIPENMEVMSLALEDQRIVGTRLSAGSRVSAYATFDDATGRLFSDVLVVDVKEGIVTIAAKPADIQTLVASLELGKVWLTESAVTPNSVTPITIKKITG